jgi:predicted metal-dependent phosphoesterase TrpH
MVERLNTIGLMIDLDEVILIAREGTIGRPHIARALIQQGYVASISEAFDRYLGNGKPGFVPRTQSSPEDSVRLIRETGAIPVLAHPFSTGNVEETLRRLVPAGLLGLEAYYGEYDDQSRARLRSIADSWDLIPTGGSDFHGVGFKEGRDLGSAPIPSEAVTRLFQLREDLQR